MTDGGEAITTGVLLVASTATVPAALPAITALTAPAQAVFYFVSSKSDGTYSLEDSFDCPYELTWTATSE